MDRAHFETLKTLQERAKYLLTLEITTKIDIVDLQPVLKAYIGEMGLPITSNGNETEDQVIAKAKAWLNEKAA